MGEIWDRSYVPIGRNNNFNRGNSNSFSRRNGSLGAKGQQSQTVQANPITPARTNQSRNVDNNLNGVYNMREQYINNMRSRSNMPDRPRDNSRSRLMNNASVPNFESPGKASMMSQSPSKNFNKFSNVGMQMIQGQNSSIPNRVYQQNVEVMPRPSASRRVIQD